MARILAIIFSICCVFNVYATDAMGGWSNEDPPESGSLRSYCESYSKFVWQVSVLNGALKLEKQSLVELYNDNSLSKYPQFSVSEYSDFPRKVIEVKDGYLVGFNKGEWGGAVYWFNKNASESYKLSNGQIQNFVIAGSRILALEGLSHMGISNGQFTEYKQLNGEWVPQTLAQLPAAPGPYTMQDNGTLLVVAENKLLELTLTGKVSVIHAARSDYGRANSIVKAPSGDIYIGAGGAVIQLHSQPSGYVEKWHTSEEDTKNCRCKLVRSGEIEMVQCEP